MPELSPITLSLSGTLLLAPLQGCHSAPAAEPSPGAFRIAVSEGPAPEYRWASRGAFTLLVAPTDAPTEFVWGIADTAFALRSPLRHGILPDGAVEVIHPTVALQSGTTYRITITLPDGRSAHREFTPKSSPQ